jgi:hypothetical protein
MGSAIFLEELKPAVRIMSDARVGSASARRRKTTRPMRTASAEPVGQIIDIRSNNRFWNQAAPIGINK